MCLRDVSLAAHASPGEERARSNGQRPGPRGDLGSRRRRTALGSRRPPKAARGSVRLAAGSRNPAAFLSRSRVCLESDWRRGHRGQEAVPKSRFLREEVHFFREGCTNHVILEQTTLFPRKGRFLLHEEVYFFPQYSCTRSALLISV